MQVNQEVIASKVGANFSDLITNRILSDRPTGSTGLRLSSIGRLCNRYHWYNDRGYDKEDLRGATYIKFLYGDMLEELLLTLAEITGHTVEMVQAEVELEGVTGHIDAIIDGCLVDIKSASKYGYQKFADGTLIGNDQFGYVGQMAAYGEALGIPKDKRYNWAINKENGAMCLYSHKHSTYDAARRIKVLKNILAMDTPPAVQESFLPIPMGKSGNMQLCTQCSYCGHKERCYEYRTFLYSTGPVYLTKVTKTPNVPEV